MTITQSIPTVSAAGFTEQVVNLMTGNTNFTQTGQWKCDQGALTDLDPVSTNFGDSTTTTTFKTTSMVGPTLPASAKPGDSWSQTYTVEITATAGTVTTQATENASESCTAIGMESVTVAAGAFNAMHVSCQINTSTLITADSQDVPMVTTAQSDRWYATNVGLVKSNDQGSIDQGKTNTSVTELTTYTIP
jgi:hypothetical protein